jgi:hypothetical protein
VREPDPVRGFLCQSRPSKRLKVAIARQAGGKLTFVVASIGIVVRQSCRLPNPVGAAKLHAYFCTKRPAGRTGRSKFKALSRTQATGCHWQTRY